MMYEKQTFGLQADTASGVRTAKAKNVHFYESVSTSTSGLPSSLPRIL